jgi:hypothetical protein
LSLAVRLGYKPCLTIRYSYTLRMHWTGECATLQSRRALLEAVMRLRRAMRALLHHVLTLRPSIQRVRAVPAGDLVLLGSALILLRRGRLTCELRLVQALTTTCGWSPSCLL